jgi:hypothetical protein
MTNRTVVVANVAIDQHPFAEILGRTRYRITLSCGCFWWQEHHLGSDVPRIGMQARCYNAEHLRTQNERARA